jgi:hypothetical protein
MYTEQPYEAQMPRQQLVYVQSVAQPPPQYYWPPQPPPHWQPPDPYQHHPRPPRHEAPREDPDDAAAGFQRLEVAVKGGVAEATRRGLKRDVHVRQKTPSGVTRTGREWRPIVLRVADDDDGAPEFKHGLMENVLRVVRDVKEQLQSNLRPSHVAAAVGALDVLREVLLYYQTVVGGAAESEPRYEGESASDLTRLLEYTALNAKGAADGVRRAAAAKALKPKMLADLDEATRHLLAAYKAYDEYPPAVAGAAAVTAKAHVDALVAAAFP